MQLAASHSLSDDEARHGATRRDKRDEAQTKEKGRRNASPFASVVE
jgi:hypothetical protein